MTDESVTVITTTRRRPNLLQRAIQSVEDQCCDHVTKHLIVIDDCIETRDALAASPVRADVEWRFVPREHGEITGPTRQARLRDLGARLTKTRWLAYLDDDNEWNTHHLHGLLETAAKTDAPAVYSWREMYHPDGEPYVLEEFPWARDAPSRRREYRRRVDLEVITPGSNIYRDGPETEVDGGEWLLDAALVRTLTFECTFTAEEKIDLVGEDDKFLERLIDAGIRIEPSRQPTLKYYVGGGSTRHVARGGQSRGARDDG